MGTDQIEDSLDERIASPVAELSESDLTAQVEIAVGVTAGTLERALVRDLDREHGGTPAQDLPPGGGNSRRLLNIRVSKGHGFMDTGSRYAILAHADSPMGRSLGGS